MRGRKGTAKPKPTLMDRFRERVRSPLARATARRFAERAQVLRAECNGVLEAESIPYRIRMYWGPTHYRRRKK